MNTGWVTDEHAGDFVERAEACHETLQWLISF
jgi:hypothetical protein